MKGKYHMTILHCADLHLDSALTTHLDKEKAKARKQELLNTFVDMVRYAEENDVSAIIIAGDMFDTKRISARARNTVYDTICSHPYIDFYYLKGNHDADGFLDSIPEIPSNLKLFGDEWTKYYITSITGKNICIAGVTLSPANSGSIYSALILDPADFNIVTLHGQTSEYRSKDKAEVIDLGSLRNKNIDYLALGHIHAYRKDDLPPRGVYCYPGCLEGRGFDECGNHGFELLDIDENTMTLTSEFIYFAKRTLYEIPVDITGCASTMQIQNRIDDALDDSDCMEGDMVRIVLKGSVAIDCEKNVDALVAVNKGRYYLLKIDDETKLAINYDDYVLDASLKGEFVRLLKSDESLSEEEKTLIIRCGIQALSGEEIEL